MPLSSGCNHVTIITQDLDRLADFYVRVFDATIRMDMSEPTRHALIDLGGGFCLHPFETPAGPDHAQGLPSIFQRGHIDHMAINFDTDAAFQEARRRLVTEGATEGRVRDFGMVRITSFTDPDGMEAEIAHWEDGEPLTMADSRVEDFTQSRETSTTAGIGTPEAAVTLTDSRAGWLLETVLGRRSPA